VSGPTGPVARECVEGYVFVARPLTLLVLRRPPSRGSVWVPVSGKVEPTDTDLEAALRRELREETGAVDPVRVESLDWHVPFRAPNGETWRLHAYAVEVRTRFAPTLSEEHDAYDWLSPEAAVARLHYPDNRQAVERLVSREARRQGTL
jgi:8-oxo-dGTP pyrophosphatase MutT (NUDIX family)